MATSNETTSRGLLDLVLRSRKALDQTKTLCSRADVLSKDSTELALDLVAVDAKTRWATEIILEQLKLIGSVAKSLTAQRSKLQQDAELWDVKRKERTFSLDSLLDDLGSQLVPPSFYETASGSSIFGSQTSEKDAFAPVPDDPSGVEGTAQTKDGATAAAREGNKTRTKWKTLRFFVDERAMEEAMERMDEDRNSLEDLLESTSSQTQSMNEKMQAIKNLLPATRSNIPSSVQEWLKMQEADLNRMAELLEDVTHHFDQMEGALRDSDAGEVLEDEDMEVLEGDTGELPSIIGETEQSLVKIKDISQRLQQAREECDALLGRQKSALSMLEELGIEMTDLVEQQQLVEVEATTIHSTLQGHLLSLSELYDTFLKYRAAYGHLVLEMDRRRMYRDAVETIINGMNEQLHAMRQEEISHREQFFKAEGAYLPEDLCPYVGDMPVMLEVATSSDEVAVAIDPEYVAEVQSYIARGQTMQPPKGDR